MKKLAMIAAGALCAGCLSAFDMPALGMNAEAKYSSEYVNRGRREGKSVFLPKAEVSMPMFEKGKLYAGTYAALGVDGGFEKVRNQVSPYIGASYDITDMFTLDAGYIHHFYTNTPKRIGAEASELKRNTSEIYFGVLADVLLSPSLYFYYDFDAKEIAIEGKVAYSFDFAQFGVNGLALDLGAELGYVNTNNSFACKNKPSKKDVGDKDYVFYGLTGDVVFSFNEHARARTGVAFVGNSAKKKSWVNGLPFSGSGHHKNFVWLNASLDCKF